MIIASVILFASVTFSVPNDFEDEELALDEPTSTIQQTDEPEDGELTFDSDDDVVAELDDIL
jgi:hypothetical protein